jgi:hypothetical protein
MSQPAGAQAQATPKRRSEKHVRLPGEDLTLQETLRVMDVAREMRQQRETAEEMFRRDELREQLREKLLRTARMSGDSVTAEEIDAAIDQYFESVHTFAEPAPGFKNWIAHCWVWRGRIVAGLSALAVVAGSMWWMFT